MKSRRKEKINVETNSSTFHFEKQTSPQIRIDLADMGGVAEDGVGVSGDESEHQVTDDTGDVGEDGIGVSGNEGEHQVTDDAGDVAEDGVDVSVNEGEQQVSVTPKICL